MCYCPVGECRADFPVRYPYCAMSPKPPEIKGKVADGDSDYALADAIENLQKVIAKLSNRNSDKSEVTNGNGNGSKPRTNSEGRYKH